MRILGLVAMVAGFTLFWFYFMAHPSVHPSAPDTKEQAIAGTAPAPLDTTWGITGDTYVTPIKYIMAIQVLLLVFNLGGTVPFFQSMLAVLYLDAIKTHQDYRPYFYWVVCLLLGVIVLPPVHSLSGGKLAKTLLQDATK